MSTCKQPGCTYAPEHTHDSTSDHWWDKYGHWNDYGYRVFYPDDVAKILAEAFNPGI